MFSKAPKRKRNLIGTGNVKRLNTNQLGQARLASKKRFQGIYAQKLSLKTQPVIFVTIDYTLANVTPNSPVSAKAEVAKKMFAVYNS